MTRRLDGDEKALWGRVMATVKPLHPVQPMHNMAKMMGFIGDADKRAPKNATAKIKPIVKPIIMPQRIIPSAKMSLAMPTQQDTLDGQWDRRIGRGAIIPDISVDLHGSGLENAYARLDGALEQAIAQHMRVILLVMGKARLHDRASGEGRGAISSVVRDWLAASRHSRSIAAVRGAHPRHGGAGALYIVLKR
jgi:DNA-nicking Smr family endonuclease